MKSLASRLQQLERVVASRPAPPGPPCPKCGREIFARPRTAQDAEEEARIMRQVSPATLMEMEALLARAWAGLPEGAVRELSPRGRHRAGGRPHDLHAVR